jgi:hypothetical protein
LRDIQQFLHYYQSRDETLQSILGKVDTLIEIQEQKMRIEIFGDSSLDAGEISKHIRGRSDPRMQQVSE